MIGVGIVGYGYAGRAFHRRLVQRAPGLELRAIATRDPERQAQAREDCPTAHACQTLDEMLADRAIDLVVIATPHDTHCQMALATLASRKHVVVDKPMAIAVADADRMVAAAADAGRMLSVFHNRRWDWDYLTVRKVIADGLIGRPYLFESTVLSYREPRRTWRAAPETMGSLFHDWGAHLVDHALQLVPAELRSVRGRVARPRTEPAIGNWARIDLDFADGTTYGIEVGNLARPEKPRWYVLGDRGGLIRHGLDPQERAFRATGNPDDAVELPEERTRVVADEDRFVEPVRGSWTSYYENVSAHLNDGEPLAVTAKQARDVIAVIDAAVHSASAGGELRHPRIRVTGDT